MASNDPTDTGGLFIGRRPGTAPIRYRRVRKEQTSAARRRADKSLATLLLAAEAGICLTVFLVQPVFWLWFGSQVDYWTRSVGAGILSAFIGMLCSLFISLAIARRVDHAWKLVRRAAGHEQDRGMLERIFAATVVVVALGFAFWLLVLHGPGSSVFSPRA